MMKNLNLNETIKRKKPAFGAASRCLIGFPQVLTLGLALCLLLLFGTAYRPVSAQSATTLRFSPNPALIDVRVGNTVVVDVLVENAENINAFDVQIDYDPNVALISGWQQGNFLPGALCLEPLKTPGSLKLACAKIGPDGSSGSATLVSLTFKATAQGGNTLLSLGNAELVNAESNQIVPVQVVPGELQVLPYRLALPLILKQGAEPSAQVSLQNRAADQVTAQQGLNLWFEPGSSQVKVGETVSISLMVEAQNAVGGFDLVFEYDSRVLALDRWAYGGFLSNLSAIKNEASPGRLWLVAVQLGVPPVSGSGTLLEFTMRGISEGTSPLTLPAVKFADASGNQYSAGVTNGALSVVAGSLPASTSTSTPTPTATIAPTSTSRPATSTPITAKPSATLAATAIRTSTPKPLATSRTQSGANPTSTQVTVTRAQGLASDSDSPAAAQSGAVQTAYPGSLAAVPDTAATQTCEANLAGATLAAMSTEQSTDLTSTPAQPALSTASLPVAEEKSSKLDLTTGIIVFDLIALAFIAFLLWRRRRKKLEGKL